MCYYFSFVNPYHLWTFILLEYEFFLVAISRNKYFSGHTQIPTIVHFGLVRKRAYHLLFHDWQLI